MKPFDPKTDREVPVIIADDHLHIQMLIGVAFASASSGVLRGVILMDIQDFIRDNSIDDDDSICHGIAEAAGVYGMFNGFKARFGKASFNVWRASMKTRNDFVVTLDGKTSKLVAPGSWSHPDSDPMSDIVSLAKKLGVEPYIPETPAPLDPTPFPRADWRGFEVEITVPPRSGRADSAPIDPTSRPGVVIPEGALAALLMMLGEKKVTIREEDMWAAEKWRADGRLRMFVQHDPYKLRVTLEE